MPQALLRKYLLPATILVLFLAGAASAYWFVQSDPLGVMHSQEESATTTQNGQGQPEVIDPQPATPPEGYQLYRNEEWGFEFWYPEGWEVREPAFYSAISLFNIAIEPVNPRNNVEAVLINITPKAWIEDVLNKKRLRGDEIKESSLGNKLAFVVREEDFAGKVTSYLVLVEDKYWVNISGQDRQKKAFEQILPTFKFLE